VQVNKALDGQALLELQALVRDVPAASHVKDYAVRLVLATTPRRKPPCPLPASTCALGAARAARRR